MWFLSGVLTGLLLTSCGFTPLHQAEPQSTAIQQNLNQVEVAIIPDQSGQFLRNALIDRLYKEGYPSTPTYTLTVDPLIENIFNFDITVDSEATRRQLRLRTAMRLQKKGDIVLRRDLMASTSFNVLESEFSTLVTERAAREAALTDLARQIERQVALYFQNK